MSTRPQYEPLTEVVRIASGLPEDDPYQRAIRRRRHWRIVAACVVVLAAIAVFMTWEVRTAASHYRRGQEALGDERYYAAIQEFDEARILFFSYRDAGTLSVRAREELDAGIAAAVRSARQEDGVRRLVERAASSLTKDEAAAVERALTDARRRVPEGPLSTNVFTLSLLDTLSGRLAEAAGDALAAAHWAAARAYAAALLAIDPEDADGTALVERADLGARLERQLGDARAAARRGQWRQALRLAEAVLDEWPDFAGAAALVREAKAALAPRPRPTPTPTATATAPPAPPAPPKPTPPPP